MADDQGRDDVQALLRQVFGAAADELDADAELGEHCWTADDGTRAYARQDEDAGVLTLVRPGGSHTVYSWPGVDLAGLT